MLVYEISVKVDTVWKYLNNNNCKNKLAAAINLWETERNHTQLNLQKKWIRFKLTDCYQICVCIMSTYSLLFSIHISNVNSSLFNFEMLELIISIILKSFSNSLYDIDFISAVVLQISSDSMIVWWCCKMWNIEERWRDWNKK